MTSAAVTSSQDDGVRLVPDGGDRAYWGCFKASNSSSLPTSSFLLFAIDGRPDTDDDHDSATCELLIVERKK